MPESRVLAKLDVVDGGQKLRTVLLHLLAGGLEVGKLVAERTPGANVIKLFLSVIYRFSK